MKYLITILLLIFTFSVFGCATLPPINDDVKVFNGIEFIKNPPWYYGGGEVFCNPNNHVECYNRKGDKT